MGKISFIEGFKIVEQEIGITGFQHDYKIISACVGI